MAEERPRTERTGEERERAREKAVKQRDLKVEKDAPDETSHGFHHLPTQLHGGREWLWILSKQITEINMKQFAYSMEMNEGGHILPSKVRSKLSR